MARTLKLKAVDGEDVKVLSAHLQDAIVAICDVGYFKEDRRFVLVANRFKWETCSDTRPPAAKAGADGCPYERTHCGLRFEGVTAVKSRNLDPRDRGQMLCLLAMEASDDGAVLLHFSGGTALRVEMDRINVFMEDMGEPWPTSCVPCHPLDDITAEATL
ncbi:MAG TPA: DUF2948 family protein [Azospirillaceae bacterium]|nr:DUF2948 family protein [Azospirillaceae bacterium]